MFKQFNIVHSGCLCALWVVVGWIYLGAVCGSHPSAGVACGGALLSNLRGGVGPPYTFRRMLFFGIVPPGALARPVLCSPLIILRASCACVRVYICVVVRSWLENVFKSIKNRVFG